MMQRIKIARIDIEIAISSYPETLFGRADPKILESKKKDIYERMEIFNQGV